jgi:hypothetical protein
MFSRKPGGPDSRAPSPPSPNLAPNLDSAFPPFLARWNESRATNNSGNYRSNDVYAPLSPRPPGGAEVLQRMNTIAPGPFAGQRGRPAQNAPASQSERNRSRSGSAQQTFRNEQGRQHFRKPSAAESIRSQVSNHSGRSMNRQSYHRRNGSASSQSYHRRNDSSSSRQRPSEAIDRFLDELQSEPAQSPIRSPEPAKPKALLNSPEAPPRAKFAGAGLPPPPSAPHYHTEFFSERGTVEESRPGTSTGSAAGPFGGFSALNDPAVQGSFGSKPGYNPYGYESPSARRSRSRTVTQASQPSEAPEAGWFLKPRPSPLPPGTTQASKPQHNVLLQREPGPSAIEPSFPASRSRSRTITRPTESTNDMRPAMPPVPVLPTLTRLASEPPDRSEMYHSPSDSGSSGYASTGRSTPPSSVGSSISRSGSADSIMGTWDASRTQKPRGFPNTNFLPPPSLPAAGGFYNSPESPADPAIQKLRSPPADPAVQYGPRGLMRESPPRKAPQLTLPSRQGDPPTFRTPIPVANKGNCQGCQTPILGKSVKAANGKLTGRYHKECFVCKTCQAPFPTAEFYVVSNAPHCARHYHELNSSLCRKCDSGIEGPYLETDRREKYHAACFACTDCQTRLNEDYFEVNGNPLCERHAFSMARSRGPGFGSQGGLIPGSRPEKRRTRLMMM